jgi:hypothetical protein
MMQLTVYIGKPFIINYYYKTLILALIISMNFSSFGSCFKRFNLMMTSQMASPGTFLASEEHSPYSLQKCVPTVMKPRVCSNWGSPKCKFFA